MKNQNALVQADDMQASVVRGLRNALDGASGVEGLLLLQLIERAAVLQRDIGAFVARSMADATTTTTVTSTASECERLRGEMGAMIERLSAAHQRSAKIVEALNKIRNGEPYPKRIAAAALRTLPDKAS